MSSSLLTPWRMGSLTLPNRVVMAPMTRCRAGQDRIPKPLMAEYYSQRAGAGLIVTEATVISTQGIGYPGTPGVYTAEQADGWKLVTEAVHKAGGRIFLQLWHCGRISHPLHQVDGALPVAPSAIAPKGETYTSKGMVPFVAPRALELREIPKIVQDFARGAARAKQAGFDGVEIHGANGYLVDQFLRDGTNKRTDRYGGSVENRVQFLTEVTEAVCDAWEPARVGVRLSPSGTFNSMSDSNPLATFSCAARTLDRLGVAYMHVVDPIEVDRKAGVPLAPSRKLRPLCSRTLIVCVEYTKETGEAAVNDGWADLVAYGMPFIANPDLPKRFERNAPLAQPDQKLLYTDGEKGYTDYPSLTESRSS